MLWCILIGAALTAATIAIHAIGTTLLVSQLRRPAIKKRLANAGTSGVLGILCSTALVLLLLQTIEVMIWAVAYLLLPHLEQINDLESATYFSMVTFGSLGYGDIVIDSEWRLLSGIECMTGVLVFGWSTAILLSVVQNLWRSAAEDN